MFPCRCSLRYSADAGRARGPKAIYAGISPDTLCGAMRRIGEPPAEGTRTVSPSSGSSSLSDEHSTQEAKFKASFLRFISLSISRPAGRDQRLCLWNPPPFSKGGRKLFVQYFLQNDFLDSLRRRRYHLLLFYPLMAPAVKPLMMFFCRKIYTIITGMKIRVTTAHIMP